MSGSEWLVLAILVIGLPLATWAGVRMLRRPTHEHNRW